MTPQTSNSNPACCILVATKDRLKSLSCVAFPSIRRQNVSPSLIIVVNDGAPFTDAQKMHLVNALLPLPLVLLQNERIHGAAGAWNHGLAYLSSMGYDGFVAILDDDDEWNTDHLLSNIEVACQTKANVVVSGLRMFKDGLAVNRVLINTLTYRDFFTGNPGWQGSNTFVRFSMFRSVGGFRDGLLSMNDRDLAIRILKHPDCRIAFTERWTATWHIFTNNNQLSSWRSTAKLAGLKWFWHFYSKEMTSEEKVSFFGRAENYFGFSKDEIIEDSSGVPTHYNIQGDLDA